MNALQRKLTDRINALAAPMVYVGDDDEDPLLFRSAVLLVVEHVFAEENLP